MNWYKYPLRLGLGADQNPDLPVERKGHVVKWNEPDK